MKKLIASLLIMTFVLMGFAPAVSAERGPGGIVGFFVGCCFGLRSGVAYTDGKALHWREWALIIPLVNIVVGIMNGVDGASGLTSQDMAAQYGANFY